MLQTIICGSFLLITPNICIAGSQWLWDRVDDTETEEEEEERIEDSDSEIENLCSDEVCMEDMNEVDFIVESLVQKNEEVSPVVTLPDGKGTVYKSTLVSMLNDNKTVSKDRLTREAH